LAIVPIELKNYDSIYPANFNVYIVKGEFTLERFEPSKKKIVIECVHLKEKKSESESV